jgi:putative phage-type endonuclease
MKIIEGPGSFQGSEAWKKWRRTVITATDSGIIIGVNKFKTQYKLWQQKLELIPEDETNERMLEGQRLEPIALKEYCKHKGIHFEPAVCIHSEYPWLAASIDGLSSMGRSAVEIKCSKKIYDQTLDASIEPYYFSQLQKQMLVTDLPNIDLFAYWEGQFAILNVLRDQEYIDKLLIAEKEFYRCLTTLESPPLTDRDYIQREDGQWNLWATNLRVAKSMKEEYEKKEKQAREKLIELAGGSSSMGGGIRLSKVTSKGRIDYTKVKELEGVNLEPYRGKTTESYRITENVL